MVSRGGLRRRVAAIAPWIVFVLVCACATPETSETPATTEAREASMSGTTPGSFVCGSCGERHEGPPLGWTIAEPLPVAVIPPGDREDRVVMDGDIAIVDGKDHFVLGNIEVPVHGRPEGVTLEIGVWVSLSPQNFGRMRARWDDPDRVDEPAYFGWLCSAVPGYPRTLLLKTSVYTRAVGQRPYIELEPTDHPLALEQRNGITMDRVRELAAVFMHPPAGGGPGSAPPRDRPLDR